MFAAVILATAAVVATPTGARTARPTATAIAVVDTTFTVKGLKVTVVAGAPVATDGKGPPFGAGTVRARTLGPAFVEGMITRHDLGLRAQRDVELKQGAVVVGTLKRGAIVRVLGVDKDGTRVETLAPAAVTATVASDALAPAAVEFVLPGEFSHETAREAVIYAGKDVAGDPRATLPPGTHLTVVEKVGEVMRVRSHGPVELEGWVLAPAVRERLSDVKDVIPNQRQIPTHEVLTESSIWAGAKGGAPIGKLRGGTLLKVERVTNLDPKGRIRVRTLGDVKLEAWVSVSDLRPLEESVWRE